MGPYSSTGELDPTFDMRNIMYIQGGKELMVTVFGD